MHVFLMGQLLCINRCIQPFIIYLFCSLSTSINTNYYNSWITHGHYIDKPSKHEKQASRGFILAISNQYASQIGCVVPVLPLPNGCTRYPWSSASPPVGGRITYGSSGAIGITCKNIGKLFLKIKSLHIPYSPNQGTHTNSNVSFVLFGYPV
jgi:hypothetical protein